jgi:hypothetical protein
MPSDSFQIAAERAASYYPTEVWFTISPSERVAAVYREFRKLDAEFVRAQRRSVDKANVDDRHPRQGFR